MLLAGFAKHGTRMYAIVDPLLAKLDGLFDRVARRMRSDSPLAYALLSPALLVLCVFGVFPILYSVYISLFKMRLGQGPFVGLENYAEALTSEDFWNSVLVTAYFAVGTIPASLVLSFLIAHALFKLARAQGFFRTIYFLPYVTSVVAAATVWKMMLHPRVGTVNTFLAWLGVSSDALPQWLLESRSVLYYMTGGWVPESAGPSVALCCVILFEIWHNSGFLIVVFLAAHTTLPRELEEAARIDGAGWFKVLTRVTVPLLSPTILFLTIVQTVKAFQAFNSLYALTGNGSGPYDTTQTVSVYVFTNFYQFQKQGYASAVATLLAIAIALFSWLQWRYASSRVHYE
jgi:ABC-type sugar transport system permease subunit